MSTPSREIQLAARPHGEPKLSDFRFVDVEVPDPAVGEGLVRNTYMSVDPYMRGRMNDVKSYVPPFKLDQAMDGGAVGEVVASNAEGLSHLGGWLGIITALLAWYTSFAGVTNSTFKRVVLPVFPRA